MQRVYPLTLDHLRSIIGMPVCAVTRNGLRYVGIMVECGNKRLVLQSPAYGFRPGNYPPDGHYLPNQGQKESPNEQTPLTQRTTTSKKHRIVRKRKHQQDVKAAATSEGAHSTNYAQTGNNPATTPVITGVNGDINLDIDDILHLFLVI